MNHYSKCMQWTLENVRLIVVCLTISVNGAYLGVKFRCVTLLFCCRDLKKILSDKEVKIGSKMRAICWSTAEFSQGQQAKCKSLKVPPLSLKLCSSVNCASLNFNWTFSLLLPLLLTLFLDSCHAFADRLPARGQAVGESTRRVCA